MAMQHINHASAMQHVTVHCTDATQQQQGSVAARSSHLGWQCSTSTTPAPCSTSRYTAQTRHNSNRAALQQGQVI
jgi:hypothetical protein